MLENEDFRIAAEHRFTTLEVLFEKQAETNEATIELAKLNATQIKENSIQIGKNMASIGEMKKVIYATFGVSVVSILAAIVKYILGLL